MSSQAGNPATLSIVSRETFTRHGHRGSVALPARLSASRPANLSTRGGRASSPLEEFALPPARTRRARLVLYGSLSMPDGRSDCQTDRLTADRPMIARAKKHRRENSGIPPTHRWLEAGSLAMGN